MMHNISVVFGPYFPSRLYSDTPCAVYPRSARKQPFFCNFSAEIFEPLTFPFPRSDKNEQTGVVPSKYRVGVGILTRQPPILISPFQHGFLSNYFLGLFIIAILSSHPTWSAAQNYLCEGKWSINTPFMRVRRTCCFCYSFIYSLCGYLRKN